MTRAALSREIRAKWPTIVAESGTDILRSLAALPKGTLRILGSSQKTEAGEDLKILTGVAYLAPADASGRNVCANSTAACRGGCLGDHSGKMPTPTVRASMQWKTALRFGCPELFFALLRLDIEALEAKAAREGYQAAVRLDGTSDLGDAERLAPEYPRVRFYEYTKSAARAARWNGRAPNLHATLSFSGENLVECLTHLQNGGNVAVPFDYRKGAYPEGATWHGFPLANGDAHDARYLDAPGHVAALSWKGPNRTRDAARADGWLQQVD